jgi:uncharacterized protein YwgA
MGRTALMKCVFFLQEARGVPLGYRFGLYTYGPYDASVLEDVKLAQAKGILVSKVVEYRNGYGYAIQPAEGAAEVRARASEKLTAHRAALKWVREKFARRSASELEMASTLVFVYRQLARDGKAPSLQTVAAGVHDIKPYLPLEAISEEAQRLSEMDLLKAA